MYNSKNKYYICVMIGPDNNKIRQIIFKKMFIVFINMVFNNIQMAEY